MTPNLPEKCRPPAAGDHDYAVKAGDEGSGEVPEPIFAFARELCHGVGDGMASLDARTGIGGRRSGVRGRNTPVIGDGVCAGGGEK